MHNYTTNSNTPELPDYTLEKAYFAGTVIATIAYGIVVVLFFQCMIALLYPAHRTNKGINWGLVAHTVVMFSLLTIHGATDLSHLSDAYIDNREFPGNIGFAFLLARNPITVVHALTFPLNQLLADGLLLYRCYIIYSMNYWVIAFPCLMYLASIATGVLPISLYFVANYELVIPFSTAYNWISFSLNFLLTLMIVVRLLLHNRNIRNAIGATSGLGGLYTAVVTMLVESCALYSIAYLIYTVSEVVGSNAGLLFSAIAEIQVIAPFLIMLRVANRSALTSEAVASGNVGSIHFRSRGGSTDGSEALADEHTMSYGETVETASQETR